MRLCFTEYRCVIEPTTELEWRILTSDIARTKLAYKIGSAFSDAPSIELFHTDATSVDIDGANARIYYENDRKILPLVRTVLDAFVVARKGLPLHAAMVVGNRSVFLVAPSGHGKSAIANYLREHWEVCVVGDDHLVIFDGHVSGNSKMRVRRTGGTDEYRALPSEIGTTNDYVVLCVQLQPEFSERIIGIHELERGGWLDSLQKYLIEPFRVSTGVLTKEQMVGAAILQRYREVCCTFLKSSSRLYEIRGSVENVAETVRSFL